MKYSEDTEEGRQKKLDYVNKRWQQLYGLQMEYGTEGIKYLLFVNSGAAAAVLAFHGTVASVRGMLWPKLMLGSFAFGVVLIGVVHILRHWHARRTFKQWRDSVDNDYYSDKKGWAEVIKEDADNSARAEKFDFSLWLAYASFGCFVFGIVIGMFNFYKIN